MQLKRITKTRISDRVIEQLVSLISTGKIRPGEKLPSELELTHQFDVGRSTVREAAASKSNFRSATQFEWMSPVITMGLDGRS